MSGCAILSPAPSTAARPAHPESATFAMNGRISIDHDGERHSVGLHWTHLERSDEILLMTPLGQTAARVYRDDKIATLDEGGKHYRDNDVESLMQQVLGWHLPLITLHQWVLGLPAADSPAQIEHDANGRIAVLRQDGWEVHYLRYAGSDQPDCTQTSKAVSSAETPPQTAGCANTPEAGNLPTRLRLDHDGMQVLLLIDEWAWNPQ
jgi:outer membrane lipoprotein LolB